MPRPRANRLCTRETAFRYPLALPRLAESSLRTHIVGVAPDGQAASTPTGLSVAVRVPQEEILTPNGLAQSDVKDTMVTLPEGVAPSPAGADRLQACSLEQIGLQNGRFADVSRCVEGRDRRS